MSAAWSSVLDTIEREVHDFATALDTDAALPDLGLLDTDRLGPLPLDLETRARELLLAVTQLEAVVAERLEQVARELSSSQGRRHDLRPSYGGLDVEC